jgi:hypothetical protein
MAARRRMRVPRVPDFAQCGHGQAVFRIVHVQCVRVQHVSVAVIFRRQNSRVQDHVSSRGSMPIAGIECDFKTFQG